MEEPAMLTDWAELEDWVRRETEYEVAHDALTPTLAVSFVDTRPDLIVSAPMLLVENADEIVSTFIDWFGGLRPDRLAVIWPNLFTDAETDEVVFGARINNAEPDGAGSWRWRTRVLFFRRDRATKTVEWLVDVDVDDPPDEPSRRLREVYSDETLHRLQSRGWLGVPEEDGWALYCTPGSTTLGSLEALDGFTVRDGELWPAAALS